MTNAMFPVYRATRPKKRPAFQPVGSTIPHRDSRHLPPQLIQIARRRREIGIRMALGAGECSVIGMVLGQTARLTLAGCAIGLAPARVAEEILYGVRPNDHGRIFALRWISEQLVSVTEPGVSAHAGIDRRADSTRRKGQAQNQPPAPRQRSNRYRSASPTDLPNDRWQPTVVPGR